MSVGRSELGTAVTLMRMALALLDKAGESGAALHLQHSIDVATRVPIPRSLDEMDLWLDENDDRRAASPSGRGRGFV